MLALFARERREDCLRTLALVAAVIRGCTAPFVDFNVDDGFRDKPEVVCAVLVGDRDALAVLDVDKLGAVIDTGRRFWRLGDLV